MILIRCCRFQVTGCRFQVTGCRFFKNVRFFLSGFLLMISCQSFSQEPYIIDLPEGLGVDVKRLKYDNRYNIDVQNTEYYPRSVYEHLDNIIVHLTGPKHSNIIVFNKLNFDLYNLQQKENRIDNGYTNDIDMGPALYPGRYLGDSLAIILMNPQNLLAGATYYDRFPEKYDSNKINLDLLVKLMDHGNPVIMKVNLK